MALSGCAASATQCPRARIHSSSTKTRTSCPPQPREDSLWRIRHCLMDLSGYDAYFFSTMELQNIQRLAVFKMRNIGDVLMITPALRALRETFPQARITVVVNSGTEAMLANNPHIDEVLVYQRNSEAGRGFFGRIGYELHFLGELRKRHFDLTISFTDGDRAI